MTHTQTMDETFWQEKLLEGVRLMEGATVDGKRDFARANQIFSLCKICDPENPVPPDVEVEAYFRQAQCARYSGQDWLEVDNLVSLGQEKLAENAVSARTYVQCVLLAATTLRVIRDADYVVCMLDECWEEAPPHDHKLRADIANQQARLSIDEKRKACRLPHSESARKAVMWIDRACEEISMVGPGDPLADHARLAIWTRAALYQSFRVAISLGYAKHLLKNLSGGSNDIRAKYWETRARIARLHGQKLRSLWFWLRWFCSR